MPSPVGHALAGLIVHCATARDPRTLRDRRRAAALVGVALCPDLDLLLRFVDGRNHHQAETHSLGAAALAGLLALLWGLAGRRPGALAGALAVGAAWASHVLLDWLARDTSPPVGLLALWPFSDRFYKFPWPVFLDIGRTLEWNTVVHDVLAAAWECLLLAPLLWLARRGRALPEERSRGAGL